MLNVANFPCNFEWGGGGGGYNVILKEKSVKNCAPQAFILGVSRLNLEFDKNI